MNQNPYYHRRWKVQVRLTNLAPHFGDLYRKNQKHHIGGVQKKRLGLHHLFFKVIRLTIVFLLLGCEPRPEKDIAIVHPSIGKNLVSVYGCATCHEISGVWGNPGNIGPPLQNWAKRKFIAGRLTNHESSLIEWIMAPDKIKPGTAMPNLGISKQDALKIAEYLYTQ